MNEDTARILKDRAKSPSLIGDIYKHYLKDPKSFRKPVKGMTIRPHQRSGVARKGMTK
jgi:hypothetical protein